MRNLRSLLVFAAAALSAQSVSMTGTAPAELAGFDTTMLKLMSGHGVPGTALAIAHKGKLVLARGYGYADENAQLVVQPDSLFRVASITKPHTAAAILKLIERGQLSMTDRAFRILSDIQPLPGAQMDPRIAGVTIQNLLEHKSGWYGEADGTGYDPMFDVVNIARAAGVSSPADARTIVRYMLGRPLDRDPGTYYSYLNFGYCVLGQVIEKVSGESVESFITANVTGPLGNNRSQFGATLTALPGEVTYYDYPGRALADSVFPTGPSMVPFPYGGFSLESNHADFGLVSNTIELLRFVTAMNGSRAPQFFTNAVPTVSTYFPPWGPGNYWYFHGSLSGSNSGVLSFADQTVLCYLTNTRPPFSENSIFFNDFDGSLTQAFNQIAVWPENDLFPQYQTSFTVVHAASYVALAVAPDQLVTLYGTNLSDSAANAVVNVQDSKGNSSSALLDYVSTVQINLVMPAGLATGPATIAVLKGSLPPLSTTIQIDRTAPGIFTANASGTGVPAAIAGKYAADGTVTPIEVFQCAAAYQCTAVAMSVGASTDPLIVSLFGTGIRHGAEVRATINGQMAPVLFAGAQSQYPGLDQVNLEVPEALAGSGSVPVVLTVDGREANTVTIDLE